MSLQCRPCRAHLISDNLVVKATHGTYALSGQLPDVCGFDGMFTKVAITVCGSQESLTGAR